MDENKNFNKAVESYEKNVDKALNAVDKVSRGANRLYIGCVTILANLFFMAFCLWGVYAAFTAYKLDTDGEVTTGTVIQLEESSTQEGGCCVYSPVVQFQVNGQTYTFDGGNASDPPAYEVGESVSVIYDPADPNTAQINKWTERWLFPFIIIPAMTFASILVTFFLVRAWRRNDDLLSNA
jgi:hypothetical protein